MTFMRRFTCGSDGSRWYGVGSTRSIGSAANRAGVPPNGSRYAPMTTPPSSAILSRSARVALSVVSAVSGALRPTDLAPTRLRRRTAFFFATTADSIRSALPRVLHGRLVRIALHLKDHLSPTARLEFERSEEATRSGWFFHPQSR